MEKIFNFINQFGPLGKEEIEAFSKKFVLIDLKKKDYLVKAGETCRYLYFMIKGMARAFYLKDGKEMVTWFIFDGEPFTPFYSFTTQKPGIEYVQLVEDAQIMAITYDDLEELYAQYHIVTYLRIQFLV